MFRISKPTAAAIDQTIAAAQNLPPATPSLLTLIGGPIKPQPPPGFAHDLSRSELGRGHAVFDRARQAFAAWEQFDLGWVHVANPSATIQSGSVVAVAAHAAGLWSINFSRIIETVDTPTQFGFLYATTRLHVEGGQERFLLNFDPGTQVVTYLLEAFSRPRHPLARLAYPFTRAMQHRFAKDSHHRLRRAISLPATKHHAAN